MDTGKRITVIDLEQTAATAAELAEFERPIDNATEISLAADGFATPVHRTVNCLGWIWRQWLLGSPGESIGTKVRPFIERGLECRKRCRSYHKLAEHDLLLLHCAVFGLDQRLLEEVVRTVADASGDMGQIPLDNGELYAAAWCGMLKYWILGDHVRSQEQSQLIWGSKRNELVVTAPKHLVVPWLKRDWEKFVHSQRKDFQKMWARARKDGWTIRSETAVEVTVNTHGYRIGQMWCWAHCALAILASRRYAVDVATDPLWFPTHALDS